MSSPSPGPATNGLSVASAPNGPRAVTRAAAGIDRSTIVRGVVALALLLFALFGLPQIAGADWIITFTSVAIYSVVAAGFGLLYGRVGMISLGQVALLSVGCWIGTRLAYATSIPFPLLLLVVGGITCAIGTLVGLPALRLSGLYLALITLMFAGATTVVLSAIDFPNGGHGFTGRTGDIIPGLAPVRRPSGAEGDVAYYRYVVVVGAIMLVLALIHVAGKPGRAWASIRESEPAALAAGVNITLYKLWAFALASFMTGVAGCLLAAQIGAPRAITFQTQDSLTLAATALIGGIFSLWGAIIAGAFNQLLPFLFQVQWGVNPNFLLVIFGAGLLQVLLTAPGGPRRSVPQGHGQAGPAGAQGLPQADRPEEEGLVIEVEDLTVKFAGVTPIDDMSVVFPEGTCGLIGPNGAGKTTFFNVMSGFVKPAAGTITAFGENLLKMADYRRARWGLRRTFQTEMAIEKLSVFDNVALIHEHSGAKRATRRDDVMAAIDFVGLKVSPTRQGGRPRRARAQAGRGCAGGRRQAAPRAAGRAGGGATGRGDRAPVGGDPAHPGSGRRARDSRRPRHEPRLGLLRDDRRRRLREADRVRTDRRRAPRRARHARLSRHGGGAVTDGVTLRIDGLEVSRGGHSVLHGISLDVPQGSVTTLLGPNGAGKSTMVLAVGGVLRASGGEVTLNGTRLTKMRPEQIRQAGVAIVPEGRRLLPDLTVEENLRVATYALSREDAKRGIEYAIELFPHLQTRWKAVARTLSGGEQQMVVLAQALVSRPKIMLVDELSLGLAPVIVQRLVPALQEAAAQGVGVLLIEQFVHVALALAESAYVIEGGRIVYHGTAAELKDHPERLHSAYLLREHPAAESIDIA